MGPGGHITVYPICNHQLLNMVLPHPDRCDTKESWTATGPKSNRIKFYSSWSPMVRALLDLIKEDKIPEWQLRILKPLVSWVEGNVALMGNACHPTLPYIAQGTTQAVEDAGVLSAILSLISIHNHYSTIFIFISKNCTNLGPRLWWQVQAKLGMHSTFQMVQSGFCGMKMPAKANENAQICGLISHSECGSGE